MPSSPLVTHRTAFRKALLAWYDERRRDLPWRTTPSLYKTVVSEFMLQQTQVKTALPYFERWIRELPDFASLAAASEERVLKLWEGLGYYSRARNLHRLGKAVASMKSVPATAAAWRELPGVGPYTAAAITSIALGAREACVDGNVVRILARLTADDSAQRDGSSAAKAFAPLATEMLNPDRPGDHNQAMMELGATVCVRHSPQCLLCPVSACCAGRAAGDPERFPRLASKSIERTEVLRAWCEHEGRLLLHRARQGSRRLAGIHEIPTPEQAGLTPGAVREGPLLARRTRGITRFHVTESIHAAAAPEMPPADDLAWIPLAEIDTISLSGPHRRWIAEILGTRTQATSAKQPAEGRSRRRSKSA